MLDDILKYIFKYENVAKPPIYKAAELLKFNINLMDKYSATNSYTEFFKENSIIDLFYLNTLATFKHYPENLYHQTEITKTLLDIYSTFSLEKDQCMQPKLFENLSVEKIEKWALETFLPKIVTELKLTNSQIHFLERIADYINRGEHRYHNQANYSHYDNNHISSEKYKELIVRYMELKAAGTEEDLLDSFSGLVKYHKEEATPIVEAEMSKYFEEQGSMAVLPENEIL